MRKNGAAKLSGEWEFYWERLLAPKDFQNGQPEPTGYLTLPSDWKGFKAGETTLGGAGYATFRLRIAAGPVPRELCLRVFNMKSAYALWIDGTLRSSSGVVGVSLATETAAPSIELATFRSEGRPIELVLQISNFHAWEGGPLYALLLGPSERMRADLMRDWAISAFFAGSLLVMGAYHLALFAFRKKSIAPLYFGFYCLLWMGNYICSESGFWVIRLLIPEASTLLLDSAALVFFFLSVPVGYLFFRSLYPREFSSLLLRISMAAALAFVGLAFFGHYSTLSAALPWYYLFSSLLIAYSLLMLHRARLRGREGASFILVGFLILGLVGLNDMLLDTGFIHSTHLIQVGMFVFIQFQSLALARMFSRSFTSVERLSSALEEKNLALEQEMAEGVKLASEVVNVSEEERRRLSHDLHDGLCQLLTGARLRCSALERKFNWSEDRTNELGALSNLLEESVGSAYSLSRGLWPVEHSPEAVGPSLEELARSASESSGVDIVFTQELRCLECGNKHLVQLYRIAQEAVANALKHARPNKIEISLRCGKDRRLQLSIQDDGSGGRGTTTSPGGLGMRIMGHRAKTIGGEFSARVEELGGAIVTCSLLCEQESEEPRST
jgi:signal transduction histidine kinase